MARTRKEVTVIKWLGHNDARKRLAATLAGNRTAHAYLISGPEGIGKSAVAIEFAKLLLCDAPGTGHAERVRNVRHSSLCTILISISLRRRAPQRTPILPVAKHMAKS